MRNDGSLEALYQFWLKSDAPTVVPPPTYGR